MTWILRSQEKWGEKLGVDIADGVADQLRVFLTSHDSAGAAPAAVAVEREECGQIGGEDLYRNCQSSMLIKENFMDLSCIAAAVICLVLGAGVMYFYLRRKDKKDEEPPKTGPVT